MRAPTLVLAVLGLALALGARAGLEDISYPILELGGCENQDACFAYCGEPANYDACLAYAEANDLLEEEEIQEYREVQELVAQGGPGGCTSESECEAFCSDLNNMNECLAFAQEHGLMDEKELEDARKVQAALDAGYSMPGGCTSEDTCEAYCEQPGNMEECLSFASAAGFMSEEEIAEVRSVMAIMQSGNSPGGCQNQEECEAYCEDEANREVCVAFAVEAGFMTQEEADAARAMGDGEEFVGPGGCTDEESCRAYCEQEQNREECAAAFGEGMGDDREDGELSDEFGEPGDGDREDFVGPGGCIDEETCRSFCSDPANLEACGAFFGGTGDDRDERGEMMEQEFDGEFDGELDELEFEFEEGERDDWHPSQSREGDLWEGQEEEYQLEGAQRYDLYDESAPDWQEFDNRDVLDSFVPDDDFRGFDQRDDFSGYDQGGQSGSPDDIYIDPGAGSQMPFGGEAPSTGGEFTAPVGGESAAPQGGEQGLAPGLNAGFVESVKRFLRELVGKVN